MRCNSIHNTSKTRNIAIHLFQFLHDLLAQRGDAVIPYQKEPGEKLNIFRKFTDTCNHGRFNMETFLLSRGIIASAFAEGFHISGSGYQVCECVREFGDDIPMVCARKQDHFSWMG